MWILDARLDNGALSTTSALSKKYSSPVQQAFEECLSPPDYASFIASFKQGNNNSDFLKIRLSQGNSAAFEYVVQRGPFPAPSVWTRRARAWDDSKGMVEIARGKFKEEEGASERPNAIKYLSVHSRLHYDISQLIFCSPSEAQKVPVRGFLQTANTNWNSW